MTQTTTWSVLLRRMLMIILCGVIAAGSAAGVSAVMTPVYKASAMVRVSQLHGIGFDAYGRLLSGERLARTYGEIMRGRGVLEDVIKNLNLSTDFEHLAPRIEVVAVRDTELIRIRAEDHDPARARAIANAIAAALLARAGKALEDQVALSSKLLAQQLTALEEELVAAQHRFRLAEMDRAGAPELRSMRLAALREAYGRVLRESQDVRLLPLLRTARFEMIDPAALPTRPDRPRPVLYSVVAAIIGLAVGAAWVILTDEGRRRVSAQEGA